ncbi:hypothetical protein [Croceicoccus bisphenolivorans]|uniref:hypothetical protein n=1 Tax=Croceicoccus bisphenolivorans TaxID=1783232 RepID=UPI000ADA1618|nr:hypothetical protein [Croceicoccus bisphenolivorans]
MQDRFAGKLYVDTSLDYVTGPIRLSLDAGVENYPGEDRFDRYRINPGATFDLPIAQNGRTRLRIGAGYEYVADNDERVFDRGRADVQLIHRPSATHRTVARVRYGFRNQSERQFEGFDQQEWLAELSHVWRPVGTRARVGATILGIRHDADDDRFSHTGYGLRLTGGMPIGDRVDGRMRATVMRRLYDDDFSAELPLDRKDTRIDLSTRLSLALRGGATLFVEGGYVDNRSNIAARDFSGVTATLGLRWTLRAHRRDQSRR